MASSEIKTFDEAMQVLLVELDKNMSPIVDMCADWKHVNNESKDFLTAMGRMKETISLIFELKAVRLAAEWRVNKTNE